jgi:hypothetical protein
VTLATVVDHEHEQEHAIAKLDGVMDRYIFIDAYLFFE